MLFLPFLFRQFHCPILEFHYYFYIFILVSCQCLLMSNEMEINAWSWLLRFTFHKFWTSDFWLFSSFNLCFLYFLLQSFLHSQLFKFFPIFLFSASFFGLLFAYFYLIKWFLLMFYKTYFSEFSSYWEQG